ncbi:AAA family ATPase [bacterium]|jgi:DNA polymerase III delta prime subunit|nr:AAA family ATPase [bacterium]
MSNFFETNLWVEKYRVNAVDKLVLDERTKNMALQCLNNKMIPNLLFYGPPGTGKTCLARILLDNILEEKDNAMIINGSANRGISLMREEIPNFLSSPPFGLDKIKIIFIDESDNLTLDAQKSFRHLIEHYTNVGRYILTTNTVTNFHDAIISRFQMFEFKPLMDDLIVSLCFDILKSEKIEYQDTEVIRVIKLFMPDIRKILNTLQSYTSDSKLKLPSIGDLIPIETTIYSLTSDIFKTYMEKDPRCQQSINKLQELLMRKDINYVNIYENIFYNNKIYPVCKVLSNKYCNNLNMVSSQAMHYMAFIYESIEALKDLKT